MDTVLFEKDMQKKIGELFCSDDYHIEPVEIGFSKSLEHNEKVWLDQDAYYYLISKELDIPITAALYLSTENNFVSTSKADWEFDNSFRMETFRNYIHVRSENALADFSFKLKFLKVTPYRE
jgi:hypothetical protein